MKNYYKLKDLQSKIYQNYHYITKLCSYRHIFRVLGHKRVNSKPKEFVSLTLASIVLKSLLLWIKNLTN